VLVYKVWEYPQVQSCASLRRSASRHGGSYRGSERMLNTSTVFVRIYNGPKQMGCTDCGTFPLNLYPRISFTQRQAMHSW